MISQRASVGGLLAANSARTLVLGAFTLAAGCSCNRDEPRTVLMPTTLAPQTSPATALAADVNVPDGQPVLQHARTSIYPAIDNRAAPVELPPGVGSTIPSERYVAVDQFGYLPTMSKLAVLVNPIHGWNAGDAYIPGPTLEVRRWDDGNAVFTGKPVEWNGSAEDPTAGDKGMWFDFSGITTEGLYFVYDPTHRVRSHPFRIGADVYNDVLSSALKMYYFNRANVEKKPPYSCAGTRCWSLGADHLGPHQDAAARSVKDRDNDSTARDLTGGWWDAGDTNKYTTFALNPVHQLLTAYKEHPGAFSDAIGIPESGNGLPDLLDEVVVELKWLMKMQPDDLGGGALLKLGLTEHTHAIPTDDRLPRYYYPEACSSATVAVAGMFAHASWVLREFPQFGPLASELAGRAKKAWDHFSSHPRRDDCDDGTIKGGDADIAVGDQGRLAATAASYLAALDPAGPYATFLGEHLAETRAFKEDHWIVYEPCEGDALMFYTKLRTADPGIKERILRRRREVLNSRDLFGFDAHLDLYRAHMRDYMYHWGSNNQRGALGNANIDAVLAGLVPAKEAGSYWERAAGLLHSFHGVNPMQLVYLTNMYHLGAEDSADEFFHTWFREGDPTWGNARTSTNGPAPGYVTGGPNRQYCEFADPNVSACTRSPVRQQPPEKAYIDSNEGWNPKSEYDQSWELTEPGIYYQASYVRLLSKFVAYQGPDTSAAVTAE